MKTAIVFECWGLWKRGLTTVQEGSRVGVRPFKWAAVQMDSQAVKPELARKDDKKREEETMGGRKWSN